MPDNKQVDIVLKWITDQQAANRASDSAKKLNSDLAAVGKTADTVSQRLSNISRDAKIERIGDQFGKMAVRIKDTEKAAALLQKRLEGIGATDSEIARATGAFAARAGVGERGGGISPLLTRLGREGRALPALNIPGAGGLSTDAISKVVATLGSLPPVALPVIGVLTALGAGFVALESSLSGVKNALNSAVNANKTYYELIASGATIEDANKRLKDLQRERAAQEQELASITTATSQAFKDAVSVYGDAGARLLFGLGNVSTADDELAKRQDELTKSIAANTSEQEGLNRALSDGTLASNDYRKALEEEAKIKSQAALAGATDEYNLQLKKQQETLMSSSQLMSKIVELNQQSNAAEAALVKLRGDKARGVGGIEIDKQITEFELQLARAGGDITRLMKLYENRKGVEDAIQHEKDLAAARKEADKINQDVINTQKKYNEDIAAINKKLAESLIDLKSAYDQANLEAEIDRQQKLADIQNDTNDKAAEAQVKNNEERVKIEEDYQKRIKEIEREFARSSTQAIQDRDAVALDAAERRRTEEQEEARINRDEKLREQEQQYQAEILQLRNNNARRIAEINLDFQRQAEQRARKYAYDQQQLALNNSRELAQRQAAYNAQLAQLRTHLQQNNDLWAAMGISLVNYVKSVKDSINNLIGGGNSAVVNAGSSGIPDLGGIFGFGAGRSSGTATAGLGVRAPSTGGGIGGVNVAVNGVGMGRNAVIREVTKQLEAEFAAAGF